MQIEVSLDVFKALTARLEYEGHTYDDLLRDLLKLDSPLSEDVPMSGGLPETVNDIVLASAYQRTGTFFSRGLTLPGGTKLRARYKGREYSAAIISGSWIDHEGNEQSSPSAAARSITGNSVNGLLFWECLRPGDDYWRKLTSIPTQKR